MGEPSRAVEEGACSGCTTRYVPVKVVGYVGYLDLYLLLSPRACLLCRCHVCFSCVLAEHCPIVAYHGTNYLLLYHDSDWFVEYNDYITSGELIRCGSKLT